ncbi:Lecithin:cholesterol acyltransferase family protein [Histomonas meleagridis]|uniref:Lecithin:cholesterol acyltransferase family protein n=1 Tax=Histomonas meleagridis TaxID=135588 RepID=UPI003559815F|nr:Lecithin:cholesterol acyltransferase family protein [Histomonas meleagridis]KAH0803360.1 Lecithin:cholesterol acyltransferase family protein [Histomonas meleagridis]
MNITVEKKTRWYCPKPKDERFWIRFKYLIPPFISCFLDWVGVDYDEESDEIKSRENVSIYTDDFGGMEGLRGTGPKIFGRSVPSYFQKYIKNLEKIGYTADKNIVGAPYDWRFGTAQPDAYFDKVKKLIEKVYEENENQKVIIISHSLGTQIAHRFLTEKTDPTWRSKYIDSCTLIAPSFSGASFTFTAFWRLNSKYLSFSKLRRIREFIGSLGSLHVHIPHSLGYVNTTLFVDKNGTNYNGSSLIEILIANGRLSEKERKIGERNFKFIRQWPKALDVNTNILYNSGFKTTLGLNTSKWKDFGKGIDVPGDGIVGSAVIDWMCNNWDLGNKTFNCLDYHSPKLKYFHKNLVLTDEAINTVLNWTIGGQFNNEINSEL